MRRNTKLLIGIIVGTIISTTVIARPHLSKNTDPVKEEDKTEKYLQKIKSNPDYSMFMKAFEKTDLKNELKKLGEYTLFIPDNRAFKKLPEDVFENFLKEENIDDLTTVLSYHIIPKKLDKEDIEIRDHLNSLEGATLELDTKDSIRIENATVKELSIKKSNMIAYTVDELILPI